MGKIKRRDEIKRKGNQRKRKIYKKHERKKKDR
ncbi:hypothetical protein E2C01_024000 [Portunus trituberculatus]|uniref:Uncharacterized protein n=1 Tax=Portunus trituberculatus TaxID=210409 RepID=A0A5B7E9B2_PORTR|nr:hypothetical protein [Portunus trituberculatus]